VAANPGAKAQPNTVAADSKAPASKLARVEGPKAAAGPGDTTALSANAAGKNADALAPVAGGGSKGGAADKGGPAAAETNTGQPTASQAPGDPATSSTTTPATLVAAAAVAVRGSPETVADLAAQIIKKLDARSTQFDVQLDPAGLGKVDVRLQIGADGKMSAAMSFDTPQAAAELRSRSNELQQALAQSGFDVSGGMSFDVSTDRGQGGQAQNQPFDQQSDSGAAFRGRAFQAALDTTADTPPITQLSFRRTSASGVDIRI
jgi:flagellar hook-length control protein FliK